LSERILEEICEKCGFPTIEEIREFKGEKLAVSVCLRCDFCNWEVPAEAGEVETKREIEVFEESKDWAEEQAKEIKAKFLAQKPIVFRVPVTAKHVEDFLAEGRFAESTVKAYRALLLKFVRWLKKRLS